MNLYETTMSKLADPRPGRVVERGDAIAGLIECRGGTLELTREELVSLASAARDVLQRVDAALDRRAAGQRPIPAHGQPARPYTAVPTSPAMAAMPTTLAAAPVSGRAALPRHAAPPALAGQEGPGGAGPFPGGGALMAVHRRPHAATRRPGRRQLPIGVWWRRLQRHWQQSMKDAYRSLQSWA